MFKMIRILFLSLALCPTIIFAAENTSTCPVLSDTLTDQISDASHERYLLVKYRTGGSQGYFDSLHFVSRNSETGQEEIENLFIQSIRGGYEIRYCSPDDREFLEPIEKFNWYSTCTGISPIRQVTSRVSLSKRKEGVVKVTAFLEDFSTPKKREITTGPCK